VCTSNPNDNEYGARDTLDFSTENRFETIVVRKDENLVLELSDKQAIEDIAWLNKEFKRLGISKSFTMRDETRLSLKRTLDLGDADPLLMLVDTQPEDVMNQVKEAWAKELNRREEAKQAELRRLEEERIEREKQEAFDKADRFEVDNFEDFATKVEEGK
jgi:hypothetical protein